MFARILRPASVMSVLGILFLAKALGAELADLKPITLKVDSPLIAPPNPVTTLIWELTNQGAATVSVSWVDRLDVVSNSLSEISATYVGTQFQLATIPPGGTYWSTNDFQLPITQSGTYSLILNANYYESFSESDYSNNQITVSFNFQSTPADLAPVALQIPSVITGSPNPGVTLVYGVTNRGPGTAYGTWQDVVYLSTNANFDPTQPPVFANTQLGPVAPGTAYWQTNTFRIPVTYDGRYELSLVVDRSNELFESQTNNNTIVVPITLHILPPDLAPFALQAPQTVTSPPKPTLQVVYAVTNNGPGAADGVYYWDDYLYFSTNAILDSNPVSIAISAQTSPIGPGGVYWKTDQVSVPVFQSGVYYLILSVNPYGVLFETNLSNNTLAEPITFNIKPPDLAPVVSQVPQNIVAPPNPILTLMWGITNQGVGAALGSWTERVVFSADPLPPYWLSSSWDTDFGPLLPGETKWRSDYLQVPILQSGTYSIEFFVDYGGDLFESNEGNNRAVVPIHFDIQPIDLAAIAVKVPTVITSAPNPLVTVTWAVTNQGIGSLQKLQAWTDAVYLSPDGILDASKTLVWSAITNGPLNAGESYSLSAQVLLPVGQSGTYFLMFVTDTQNTLVESNKTNNVAVVPIVLNIMEPPRIGDPGFLANGAVQLPVYGTLGTSYFLEVSTNLVNWETLLPFGCTSTPTYVTDQPGGNFRTRFYRVVLR